MINPIKVLSTSFNDILNDLLIYDPKEKSWTEYKIAKAIPKPRNSHSAVIIDSSLLIFGGWSGESVLNDMYAINLNGNEKTASFKILVDSKIVKLSGLPYWGF